MKKECIVCGYDVIVHDHHIVPLSSGGCECDDNKVMLCPNHHGYLTHPNRHPFQSKKIEKLLPKGKTYKECPKCNEKWKAMQSVLDMAIQLIGLDDPIIRKEIRIKTLKLQIRYNFGMEDVLHRLMGYSYSTLDRCKDYSKINKEKQDILNELLGVNNATKDIK